MHELREIQWPLDNLPKKCLYLIDQDHYSQFYDVDSMCKCGSNEWDISLLQLNIFDHNISLPPKRVYKCIICNEMRTVKLKDKYLKIIDLSQKLLQTLIKTLESEEQCLYVIKNMISNLEIKMDEKKSQEKKEKKIVSLKKFCDDSKIDEDLIFEMAKKIYQDNSK